MTDQDAQAISRLLTLYGVQPLLTRIGQVVRSFSDQQRPNRKGEDVLWSKEGALVRAPRRTWTNEDYRMKAAMKGYYHPSASLNRSHQRPHLPCTELQPWESRKTKDKDSRARRAK